MQKVTSLSDLRSQYASGKLDRKILEGLIFQYLLDNFERFRLFGGNRDRYIDFVGWLYPRLSRAVDYYKEKGSNFDAYINSIIQWSCKEYKAKEAEHRITELACWKARAEEMEVRSNEPEYSDDRLLVGGKDCEGANDYKCNPAIKRFSKRQILILFLKSYYFVTGELLEKTAAVVGMEREELELLVDRLHSMRARKEERINLLKERIHSQYYRCLTFQKRLSEAAPGTARYEKLKYCSERAKRRYASMKQRFACIRTDATNRQIGEILNIPKGTIDSALHAIKEKTCRSAGFDPVRVPLEAKKKEMYDGVCCPTATVSMQAIPQMS